MDVAALQQKVRDFAQANSIDHTIETRIIDLVSEVGEVGKEILKMNKYGTSPLVKNNDIDSELGDIFYSLINLANKFDVNLETSLEAVLQKYSRRLQKGSAGSENEK